MGQISIHITLVTYALSVRTLVYNLSGEDVTWRLFTHSANPDVVQECLELAGSVPNVRLHDYRTNRGLARSWNDGLVASADADVRVILNDDMQATRADLDVLVAGALAHPEIGIVEVEGTQGDTRMLMNYGFTAINRVATDTVGYFDEAYQPIYGEDCDYSRRCALLGVRFASAGPTGVVHTGNATIKTVPDLYTQNRATFERNRAYHTGKHGGGYSEEVFLHPWNDPALSWTITADNRHNPYPGRERTDLEIIRI